MNPHFRPVGKPAPPRPRSTESFIVWMTSSGSMARALGSAWYPPCAPVGRERERVGLVPVRGQLRGQQSRSLRPPVPCLACPGRRRRAPASSRPPWRPAGRPGAGPAGGPSAAWPSGNPARIRDACFQVHSRGAPRVGAIPVRARPQAVDQVPGRLRGQVVEELPVDHHHRRVVAGRVALQVLQADLAVGGRSRRRRCRGAPAGRRRWRRRPSPRTASWCRRRRGSRPTGWCLYMV